MIKNQIIYISQDNLKKILIIHNMNININNLIQV
jgi:hypothetical protein